MQITLAAIHPAPSPQSVPLAAAYLAAALENSPGLAGRVTVTILDLYCHQAPEECAAAIAATSPDMVGFSVYLWNRTQSSAAARLLRQEGSRATIFCGGPEATATRGEMLASGEWDFIIAGEGELTLVAVVQSILAGRPVAGIPGVATLAGTGLSLTPAAPLRELDTLPSPYLSGTLKPADYPGILWQIARGCSFACDFCFDSGEHGGARRFSLERIEAELALFARSGVSQVFVLDSTFNQDKRRAKEILRLIARIAPHIHFHFEVRSEFIDREQARLFAAITCSLQIGLQSASPEVLRGVGRSFNRENFVSRIGLLNEAGAIFGFDLIYGLPGDTLDGFRASLDFALALYPNHLDIFPLALLPGTRLAGRSRDLDLQHLADAPYTLLATPDFPASDMAAAHKLAAACDIFYSRGKAVAWFSSVVAETGLAASAFLQAFADYLGKCGSDAEPGGSGSSEEEILRLQRGFLAEIFASGRLKSLLPLVLDLVEYNYHYAAALMAVPPPPLSESKLARLDIPSLPLKLAGSARLATFSYEILEILESGVPDLRRFAAAFSRSGSTAVIYPRGGEVFTESLIKPYFRLLERLDGVTPAGRIAANLRIPRGEALSFLEFALAEGIVVRGK
ncbi:MAG TPA: radical SAM protein [Geobacteraceae bacterium]|nr:radical SAM protein [Geobacteraceae bacterium]